MASGRMRPGGEEGAIRRFKCVLGERGGGRGIGQNAPWERGVAAAPCQTFPGGEGGGRGRGQIALGKKVHGTGSNASWDT